MRLDLGAVKALSLFPAANAPPTGSLFGLLNRCHTAQGSRLLAAWLRAPLVDVAVIEGRQRLVAFAVEGGEEAVTIDRCLRNMPDLQRICKKLQRERSTLQVSRELVVVRWYL